jgi:hypothetical protein
MVCGIVSAGATTAGRDAESGASTQGRWTRVLYDGDIDAVCPAQSTDRRDGQSLLCLWRPTLEGSDEASWGGL